MLARLKNHTNRFVVNQSLALGKVNFTILQKIILIDDIDDLESALCVIPVDFNLKKSLIEYACQHSRFKTLSYLLKEVLLHDADRLTLCHHWIADGCQIIESLKKNSANVSLIQKALFSHLNLARVFKYIPLDNLSLQEWDSIFEFYEAWFEQLFIKAFINYHEPVVLELQKAILSVFNESKAYAIQMKIMVVENRKILLGNFLNQYFEKVDTNTVAELCELSLKNKNNQSICLTLLDARNLDFEKIFISAADYNCIQLIEFLIDNEYSFKKSGYIQSSIELAFIKACERNHFEIAQRLVSYKDFPLENGLMASVKSKASSTSQLILSRKVNYDIIDEKKQTLLMIAVKNQSFEIIKSLLNSKEINKLINFVDEQGFTALTYACQHENMVIYLILRAKEASVTKAVCLEILKRKVFAFVESLQNDRVQLFNFLTNHEIFHAITQNPEKMTVRILKIIENLGVKFDEVYTDSDSLLHFSIEYCPIEVVKYLMTKCDINTSLGMSQTTPLHLAIRLYRTDVIEALLEMKVNTKLTTLNGVTPCEYARQLGYFDLVSMLEEDKSNSFPVPRP